MTQPGPHAHFTVLGAGRRAGLLDPEVTLRVVAVIARRPDTGKAPRFIPSRDDAGAQSEES